MPSPQTYDFALDRTATARRALLGREGEPLLQVEGLLRRPGSLVEFAATEARFAPAYGPQGGYPGLRADAPLDYVRAVVDALDPTIRAAFGLGPVKLARAECSLSLVTLPPAELVPGQRIPHIDTTNPLQFALLHYLCSPGFGGTAFYRHRQTGFEILTPERLERYDAVREREEREVTATGYIATDTAHFEQTARVDAAFNRLVVYRSRVLHSGVIAPNAPLSPDPRQGRLTANIFLTYLPA